MPKCGVCGKEAEKLYQCSVCRTKFCGDDGTPEEKLCNNCIDKEILEGEHEEEREKAHEGEELEEEEDPEEEEADKDENLNEYRLESATVRHRLTRARQGYAPVAQTNFRNPDPTHLLHTPIEPVPIRPRQLDRPYAHIARVLQEDSCPYQ